MKCESKIVCVSARNWKAHKIEKEKNNNNNENSTSESAKNNTHITHWQTDNLYNAILYLYKCILALVFVFIFISYIEEQTTSK